MDAVALLENVAAELQNPTTRSTAEAALLAFRASPACLEGVRAVLDSSNPQASAGARFQAALALRGAVLSRWNELSPASVDALRRYLLDKLLLQQAAGDSAPPSSSSSSSASSAASASAAAAGERLVRTQLLAAHACILKRAWGWEGWTDADRRGALAELEAAAAGGAGARAAAVALASLEAVVSEFSPVTASPLGQPLEYHERCRASLQREWLPRLWGLAVGASAAAAAAAVGAGGGEAAAAAAAPNATPAAAIADADAAAAADAALSLASAILSWDFSGTGGGGGGGSRSGGGSRGGGGDATPVAQVRPTKEFRELLLRSPAVASLLSALPRLQAAARAAEGVQQQQQLASRLFASARQVVALLCGLDGPAVFPSSASSQRALVGGGDAAAAASAAAAAAAAAAEGRRARREHSASMLRAVLPWAWPPLDAARAAQNFDNDGAELADAARALGALAAAQGAAALSEVAVEGVPAAAAAAAASTTTAAINGLSALAELTVACLATGGADGDADGGGGPAGDASAVLLDGLWDALSRDEAEAAQARAAAMGSGGAAATDFGNGNGSIPLDPSLPAPLPPAVSEASSRVFAALVSAELASAAAGAAEDEAEGEATAAAEDEGGAGGGADAAAADGASRAAAIGLASAAASCRLLSQALAAVRQALIAASASGSDPSVPLEQLVWLARASAALLSEGGGADDGCEPALHPRLAEASAMAAAASSGNGGGAEEDPVLALSSALLEAAAYVGGGGDSQAAASAQQPPPPPCSPRLLEALSLALSRWAATFLLPDLSEQLQQQQHHHHRRQHLPAALALAFGGPAVGGRGEAALAGLARLAVLWLTSTPGETDLHAAVAKRLLPALERRPEASAALLVKGISPEWSALAEAFSFCGGSDSNLPQLAPALEALSEPLLRAVGAALARAASGAPDAGSASAFVSRLAAGPTSKLALLAAEAATAGTAAAGSNSSRAAASAPRVLRAAESWRGLIKGCPLRARPALAAAFGAGGAASSVAQLAAASFRGAKGPAGLSFSDPRCAKALLRLAADAVDALAPHAPSAADGAALARWALGLARAHAASRAGFVAVAASARLREAEADDGERELRALVKLVATLAARAAVADSFGGGGGGSQDSGGDDDPAVSVFSAFEALLPLVTPEALSYPKLARAYYGLLGDVLETWPERVPALPAELGSALLVSLDAGAASSDHRSAGPCLEALGSLARWAASNAAAPGPAGQGAQQLGAALARRFVGPLLARLLLDGGGGGGTGGTGGAAAAAAVVVVSREATDAGADALLPLATAAPQAWREACDALVASVESEENGGAGAGAGASENNAASRSARLRAALAALEAGARPDESLAASPAAATTPSGRAVVTSRVVQERAVKRKFRAAMARFVADARGIVRTC